MLGSVAVLLFVTLWIVLLVTSDASGSVPEQLERLRGSSARYRWSFVNASLIAPALITTIVLLFDVPARTRGRFDIVGTVFLSAYLAVISLAYVSQYTLFPRTLAEDALGARRLYFGDTASVPYMLAMLGYALFGVGAMLLAPPLLGAGGIWVWAGWLLFLSGLTSVVGFVGFAAGAKRVEFLNVIGGVLIVPFAIVVLIGASKL